jgi:hypothetical protein
MDDSKVLGLVLRNATPPSHEPESFPHETRAKSGSTHADEALRLRCPLAAGDKEAELFARHPSASNRHRNLPALFQLLQTCLDTIYYLHEVALHVCE